MNPIALLLLTAALFAGEAPAKIERLDPELDRVIAPDAAFEVLSTTLHWSEGPVWDAPHQRLLFSDIPGNVVLRWSAAEGVQPFLADSGIAGPLPPKATSLGSNGLALDAQGRLMLCQHGNRAVIRLEPDGTRTVLADRFEGKRFNSPNDLVYRQGDLYFTDPAFGLEGGLKSPDRELPYTGLYRLRASGRIELLAKDLMPNGLAFAPDGATLYVTTGRKIVAYPVDADGDLGERRNLFELPQGVEGAFDGMRVDVQGRIYAANWKDGILVLAPDGRHLGTLHHGGMNANCAFGDSDRRTLFITAAKRLLRIRLLIPGCGS